MRVALSVFSQIQIAYYSIVSNARACVLPARHAAWHNSFRSAVAQSIQSFRLSLKCVRDV